MGMVLGLTQLTDETIERILADPPLVWRILAPDDNEVYERARREANRATKPGFFSRLFGGPPAPPPPKPVESAPFVLADGEGKESYFDKSWHGIHFLLTGSAEGGSPPLDFLVDGGRDVGVEDDGYGVPRVFSAAQVRDIAAAVGAITDEELAARFDPKAMEAQDIYPSIIWVRDGADALKYVMAYMTTLRETVTEAAGTNRGLMVSFS